MQVFKVKNKGSRTLLVSASDWGEATKIAKRAGLVRRTSNCRRMYISYSDGLGYLDFRPTVSGVVSLESSGSEAWYMVLTPFSYKYKYKALKAKHNEV